jgi:hypothetical protein
VWFKEWRPTCEIKQSFNELRDSWSSTLLFPHVWSHYIFLLLDFISDLGEGTLTHTCNLSICVYAAVRDREGRHPHPVSSLKCSKGDLACRCANELRRILSAVLSIAQASGTAVCILHSVRKLTFQTSSRYITKALCHRGRPCQCLLRWIRMLQHSWDRCRYFS